MKTNLGWLLTVLLFAEVHYVFSQVRFAPAVNYPAGLPSACTVADFNGDGKVDLIVASVQDNTLTVLTNNGSGGFGTNAAYSGIIDPGEVIAADVNGDGKVDLICSSNGKLLIYTRIQAAGHSL